jgi:hypothetical protein
MTKRELVAVLKEALNELRVLASYVDDPKTEWPNAGLLMTAKAHKRTAARIERALHDAAVDIEKEALALNAVYAERSHLVSLLASIFPSGTKHEEKDTSGFGNCVFIDFPWGQASWHYHDRDAHLFQHLPRYEKDWDGHTTEAKYAALKEAAVTGKAREPFSKTEEDLQRSLSAWDRAGMQGQTASTAMLKLEARLQEEEEARADAEHSLRELVEGLANVLNCDPLDWSTHAWPSVVQNSLIVAARKGTPK